ncbi:MAG TPA: phage tail sheath C-terminal domain-containing protein [Ignavibacteria bacterium]|nr:phage tail sheath C-terminal domain-containing protein [Ignavibacteria bacterium]HMR39480.1 phage tail sheath C-terminal domain-containing protein [Ignavibacteria bacterium]
MSQINESAIKTPGVYVNEIPSFPPSVAQVATAIPAFIGYTQKALDADGDTLENIPTVIYSMLEYETYFGKAENEADINADVVITTNSGQIISLSAKATINTPSANNMYYCLRSYFDNGGGKCYIVSVGVTGGAISLGDLEDGRDILEAYDEPTLILFPEGQSLSDTDYYSLVSGAIDQCAKLQDRFTIIDVHTQGNTTENSITGFRTAFTKSDNLNYAAAYYPNLKTTYDYSYTDAAVDVSIDTDGGGPVATTLDTLITTQSSVYFAVRDAISKLSPVLPPGPAVAGIYAKVDGSRGVWKSPANVSVNSIYDVTDTVTDQEQESMNVDVTGGKSVNAIRTFAGRGILIWGARTLAGNDNEWRYVSVRRFFIMVEESCKKASAQFVFEPNDANTWIKVRAMIENYLTNLWRQGALAGAKPEHAFYVRIGLGQTMTAQDILEGRMIVEIGMAAVRPAEFIILRFMHKMQES